MKKRFFLDLVNMNREWFCIDKLIKDTVLIFPHPAEPAFSLANNTSPRAKLAIDYFIIQLKIITGFMKDISF